MMGKVDIKSGPAGVTEVTQLHIFKCNRCGATDKVLPHSGFLRTHTVFNVQGKWKHRTTKMGAAVTNGPYTTKAGTANVTSLDHDLP